MCPKSARMKKPCTKCGTKCFYRVTSGGRLVTECSTCNPIKEELKKKWWKKLKNT